MAKTSRKTYSEPEKECIIERFHESDLSVNQFALNEKKGQKLQNKTKQNSKAEIVSDENGAP